MRIFKWTPAFTPAQESSLIPIWVCFPELPAHLFNKDALFAVANMIGTPLQVDDCAFNQSKVSKARIGIEIDLTKPLVEGFNLQINGVTIHQKVEYEQLPKYCNLCKHVGHYDLECYTMGNAPRPPPRAKKSKGKETMGTEEQVAAEKAKAFERGECSKNRYSTNLSNDNVNSGKHGEHDEHDDNIVMNDEHVDITCEVDKMGEETVEHIVETELPSDNLVVGDVYFPIGGMEIQKRKKRINLQQASKLFRSLKFFGMTARPLKEWDDTDESEGKDDVNPDCYSKGDAPKPPPRKQRKRAAVEVERGKAVVQEVGESSKTRDQPEQLQPAKDTRYHTEHQTETMTSVNELSVPADEVNIPCEAGKMGDLPADIVSFVENIVETNLPSDNLVIGVVYPPIASELFRNLKLFGMTTPPLDEWDETDESEGEDDDVNPGSPWPVKIQDPVCSLNLNQTEIEEGE
ncbi:UNVERIFIED_CONTAM: hypothetical protein Sindi_2666000 [Sesamum indicum]